MIYKSSVMIFNNQQITYAKSHSKGASPKSTTHISISLRSSSHQLQLNRRKMSLESRVFELKKALETGESASVTFIVGCNQISAHKELLSIFSPVFR